MLPNDFKLAKTGVFWDTGDCPIPKGISARKIYENIESALTAMGYVGKLAIAAYSDMEQDPAVFDSSGITLLRTGDRHKRRVSILDDSMFWAGDLHPQPFNLMMISGDMLNDLDCFSSWNERNGNILLALPENEANALSELLYHHVNEVWGWETLSSSSSSSSPIPNTNTCRDGWYQVLQVPEVGWESFSEPILRGSSAEEAAGWERGREPILNTSRDSWREVPRGWDSPDQSSIFDVENYMKNIQLAEQSSSSTHRIATAVPTLSDYKLAEIGIFWNTGDCPIPKGISPRKIYENIESALNAMGYVGKLSITAFSGMKQDPADFDSSGITLLQTRDKTDRFYELLYNLTEWAYDHGQGLDRKPFNLMLISKDISEDDLYRNALLFWSARNGNILLAQPQILADRLAQFEIVSEFWFWKSLSVGEKPISHRRLSKIFRRSLLQSHIADKIAKRLTRSSTSRPAQTTGKPRN